MGNISLNMEWGTFPIKIENFIGFVNNPDQLVEIGNRRMNDHLISENAASFSFIGGDPHGDQRHPYKEIVTLMLTTS